MAVPRIFFFVSYIIPKKLDYFLISFLNIPVTIFFTGKIGEGKKRKVPDNAGNSKL